MIILILLPQFFPICQVDVPFDNPIIKLFIGLYMKDFDSLGLRITNNQIFLLDQQLLPDKEEWIECITVTDMENAIKLLKVRGAPLIGLAAASMLTKLKEQDLPREEVQQAAEILRNSRPTAVNLMNAIDRIMDLNHTADEMMDEDVTLCENMGKNGAALINDGDNILTHCNTGGLATGGIGTALGVIRTAHEEGKKIHVFVDETRPLLQGGRLTTWELKKLGIPYTLICDNMAATLMRDGKIDKVFLGADRVSTNGDFANKIGTYSVAVLCNHHKIPFYTVAPITTIDQKMNHGSEIEIEQREDYEVQGVRGSFGNIRWAPESSKTFNPAFDVTPIDLLTGIVFDFKYLPQEEIKAGKIKDYL